MAYLTHNLNDCLNFKQVFKAIGQISQVGRPFKQLVPGGASSGWGGRGSFRLGSFESADLFSFLLQQVKQSPR